MEKEEDFLDVDEPSDKKRSSGSGEFEGRILVDLSLLHNVPLQIIVELGRTDLSLKDLLTLHIGSTIELNKLAGEPLEFIIGDRTAAKGEVVVLNEKFALRLTDIIDPLASEREQG